MVKVHEEDVLVFLVTDGLTHGLEANPSNIEGLNIEINRLGGILGSSVEDSSGLNPGGHGGVLEFLLEVRPKLGGGGLGLEHGLVLLGDLEVDESPGKLVILQPLGLIISTCFRHLLFPRHHIIQVTHLKDHVHLKLPLEPVVRSEGVNFGDHGSEFFSIVGHGKCRGR